jgi:hypothetical protein
VRCLLAALAVAIVAGSERADGQGVIKIIEPADSLRNMTVMRVVVEDMPGLQNVLTAGALETAITRRLRQTGIDVPESSRKGPVDSLTPYLYANINAIRMEPAGYVYSISLQFKRAVEVNNIDSNRNFLFAPTWERAGLAIVPLGAARNIQEALDNYVTDFLQDFLDANLRK